MKKAYLISGVAIGMVAAVAGAVYLKTRPQVLHMREGLQPKDTQLVVGKCAPGEQDEKGFFTPAKPGLRSVGWDDDGVLRVRYLVVTNCDVEFTYGGYRIEGGRLVLEFSTVSRTFATMPTGQRVPVRAACDCGYDLQYKIVGLQRKNFSIDAIEVTK